MKRAICFGFAVIALTGGTVGQGTGSPERSRAMLDTYCAGCHSTRIHSGGVVFEDMNLNAVHDNARVLETAVRKLRGRLMPPPGNRQPDQSEIDAFVGWAEAALDRAASEGPVAGHVPIQRLTRTEYATSVNDLLGIELDAKDILPAEIEVNGFENVAAALSVSPAFLDQYVAAARRAARLAVGEPMKTGSAHYHQPDGIQADDTFAQAVHIDGLPLGTRGGMRFRHDFPADGEYRFTIPDLGADLYSYAMETRHTVVIVIDGTEVYREQIGGTEDLRLIDRGGAPGRAKLMERFANIPIQVKAGYHDVGVTFIERAEVESDASVKDLPGDAFSRGYRAPRLRDGVQVAGPFDSPGVSDTPSRQRIFVCHPKPGEERACARRIAATLARRAFRRPVTSDEVDSLMPFFDDGRRDPVAPKPSGAGERVAPKPPGEGEFDSGVEQLVAAVLVSPEFLYRAIRTPKGDPPVFPLSSLELASRLSFFLWSEGPDDTLLDVAAAGKLSDPAVLEAQALRMLKDPRASSLVRNFAFKWLDLDKLGEVEPDPNLFRAFNEGLRQDMRVEAESFIASVLLEDRNVGDLLTADHTFLNERLAKHYGVSGVVGPQFRRVTLADPRRWGLLGKGAVLLRTSYGDRTSPVLRGAWVLGKLMGTPPTPPPPDVDTDLSQPKGQAPKTLRARLESHRVKPGCRQCHGVIDPIGLAMENFDAIGRWRDEDTEAQAPIDAKTVLPNGRSVDGPAELRQAIFGGRDLFVRALTERLMMYALGRELQYFDMPQVRAVVRRAAAQDYRLSAIVSGIVTSDAFRMQARAARPENTGSSPASTVAKKD